MESILKNVYINKIQIPKIKGHMRLELRGCRETDVIEHDNHMTAALEKILTGSGLWLDLADVWGNVMCPTYQKAFGGIQLLDTVLTDDALTVPGGTEVTACASYGIANNDTALTQGSYNTKESVLDWPSKKMTYVYDWTTNQGNGTIASAALTNERMGRCGFGDAAVAIGSNTESSIQSDSGYRIIHCPSDGRPFLVNDQYAYAVREAKDDRIYVIRYTSNRQSVSPFSNNPIERGNTIAQIEYEEFEVMKSEIFHTEYFYTDGVNVYFAPKYKISENETAFMTILRTDSMTTETISIKNTTGNNIRFDNGFEVYNNHLYTTNGDSTLFEIDLANTADIKMYVIGPRYIELNRIANLRSGKLYINSYGQTVVFDTVTKSIKASKLANYRSYNICSSNMFKSIHRGFNEAQLFELVNFAYLSTINNLDKPVQKTADKTMKVTYTIQQE